MRISDWSSDVCSSDLLEAMRRLVSSVSVASWAICILLYLVINAGRANRVHACDGRRLLCDERQNARKPRAPSPGKWSLLEQGCQVSRIGREHLDRKSTRLNSSH